AGERLLAEHRQAGLDRGEHQLGVGVGGGRDQHPVDARREQLGHRADRLGAHALGDLLRQRRHRVGHDQRVDGVQAGEGLGVEGPDPAEADQAEPHQSNPPNTFWSQSITEPVTTPLRSDSRNTTKSAISSTCPSLPIGSFRPASSRQPSSAPWKRRWVASSPSVSVQPMSRPLIRIRSKRWAWAALRVSPASPALAATYGARYGCPPSSDEEMMLTIVPGPPRRSMSRTAACMRKNGPRRLIATY